jgi:predicted transglutaminase-like cysteine proteinase
LGRARRHGPRAALAVLSAVVLAIAGDAALARRKTPPPEPAALSLPKDLFGAGEIVHPPATDFAKWTETIARYERERSQERALCAAGDCTLVRWREFLETLRGKDALTQLKAVNAHLNRIPYRTDHENYGADDYWATPREFFARGGDCEDYAIAKYLSLKALGWPAERLRVAVVHDNARDLVHAALIAYHGGDAYVLDIEITEVTDHRNIARYLPIFSISENGWWSYQTVPPVEAAKAIAKATDGAAAERAAARVAARTPAWHSPHLRHKPGRPAKLAAKPPAPRLHAWRSPHLKHERRSLAKAAPAEPAVVRSTVMHGAAATPLREAPEPEVLAEPGERIEELFLPGAN